MPWPSSLAPRLVLAVLALASMVAAGACAGPGVLVGPGGEHRLTATDQETGLTVVVTSGVWNGQPRDLPDDWTVLHVLVANQGDAPVRLAPGDFELRDERGFGYELLDPGAVFELADPDAVDRYGRTYHRDYDPGGPVEFEPIVPPGTVAERALPWGVLEPGTQMRGFVYFERLESTGNAATLHWHMTRPDGTPIVDLRFDLHVSRPHRRTKTADNG